MDEERTTISDFKELNKELKKKQNKLVGLKKSRRENEKRVYIREAPIQRPSFPTNT